MTLSLTLKTTVKSFLQLTGKVQDKRWIKIALDYFNINIFIYSQAMHSKLWKNNRPSFVPGWYTHSDSIDTVHNGVFLIFSFHIYPVKSKLIFAFHNFVIANQIILRFRGLYNWKLKLIHINKIKYTNTNTHQLDFS